ncbi:membrane-bound transcription factor site-2 protease homolog isoform X2 [Phoenix dactylifera]|uniref:Endopeptidase S2P n=1 Tax=Phoenix dactylifera TaxID=42345 RepID=A0A8B7C454_PHODC|nr:membrane-bound transcription factor site-2 protease homolog isoform X2 [Phoenix dactylifera]XP_008791414.2 membrane-bound transcription factor site-2 protease homolog isoform X2 [Phoenix dactylifera]
MANRWTRRRREVQTRLPLHVSHPSSSISYWYCDFKIYNLNERLFSFGCRYARFLRVWFTVGVAFSFMALLGVSVMLLWDSAGPFHLRSRDMEINSLSVPGLSLSIMDTGIMIVSTLISVALHEFGHAVAAASEGLQIEYIAIFLAVLFPGALVAFNYDMVRSLPHFAALRIYCAGIWHNVMFCAVCALALFLLPLILHPVYLHNEGPMVLGVPQTSALSGFLSPYDVIVSLDGSNIKSPQEWMKKMAQINAQILPKSTYLEESLHSQAVSGRKGYCIPNSWVEESRSEQFSCPDELTAFVRISCSNSSLLVGRGDSDKDKVEDRHCLPAKDVVKLKKCGDEWEMTGNERSHCACSEEESCMAPVQIPGLSWVEISYSSPYSSECLKLRRNLSSTYSENNSGSTSCGGSFVYVGDVPSVAYSIQLSAYQPRWSSIIFSAYLPYVLEKLLGCAFHVSATLGLLNSLPVYFLDGESILETSLCYITWLTPRRRRGVLRFCLATGTLLSVITILRILYSIL